MLNEATGGDQHIRAMGELNNLLELLLRHQRKGAAREFRRVDIVSHRLKHILKVAFAHRSVVWPANLGNASCAGFALALIHTNKRKCSFAHLSASLSPFKEYAHLLRLITRSTALLLSFPGEPPSLQWTRAAHHQY